MQPNKSGGATEGSANNMDELGSLREDGLKFDFMMIILQTSEASTGSSSEGLRVEQQKLLQEWYDRAIRVGLFMASAEEIHDDALQALNELSIYVTNVRSFRFRMTRKLGEWKSRSPSSLSSTVGAPRVDTTIGNEGSLYTTATSSLTGIGTLTSGGDATKRPLRLMRSVPSLPSLQHKSSWTVSVQQLRRGLRERASFYTRSTTENRGGTRAL